MLIGEDFNKIEVQFFDFIILEPNALVTDTLMAIVSLYLGFLLYRKENKSTFSKWWFAFFILFGISSFLGGLGHALFFYFGAKGKILNWITGIITIYLIERAMISSLKDVRKRQLYEAIVLGKLVFVFVVFIYVILTQPIEEKPELGFLPLAIHTIIGVFSTAGLIGFSQSKTQSIAYKYFYFGVAIILPSAFFYLLKINPIDWFDKNDISHLFITIGVVFFYIGVKAVQSEEKLTLASNTN